jgi:hypothetical protein
MQTLVFNTKTKSVVVYEGEHHSKILYTFQDVPTVKVWTHTTKSWLNKQVKKER